VANPTAHLDALSKRKQAAEADAEALKGALKLVEHDLTDLRSKEREKPDYDQRIDDARTALTAVLDQVAPAAQALADAIAVRDWLHGEPWDPSTDLPVEQVWPKVTGTGYLAHPDDAVRLADTLTAIGNL